MPRAIWSGSISFGLVNAPVRMYSAISEKDVRFHLVHAPDGGRIGYEKVCHAEDDRPVPSEEIAKAYETEDGELVLMGDEDFAAAEAEDHRQIRVLDFVPHGQIDPIHFERTYYLGPEEGSERVYALLRRAMADSGLSAVVRYVFHNKESLGLLRVRDEVITLEKMYFSDEVRPHADVAPEGAGAEPSDQELDMARRLIEAYAGDFDPERYTDTHRERLMGVIESKRRGERVRAPEPAAAEEPPDLLEALRASLGASGGRDGGGGDGGGGDGLGDLSVDELRRRAREAGVRGRSRMSKDELREALEAAA